MFVVDSGFKQLYWDARHKTDLDAQALELWEMKQALQETLAQRARETEQEQKDVQALEGRSLKGLLLGLTGKKEDALKKERRDVMEAKINQEIAVAELASVANKLEHTLEQQRKLGDCQEQFWQAFPSVYVQFRNSGEGDQAYAQELEMQMIVDARQHKEALEALMAAYEAKDSIQAVLRSLNAVRASEDEALAPGSETVRGKIVRAQEQVNAMRDKLSTFKEELLDLNMPADLCFDLHGFLLLEDDCLIGRSNNTNISEQYHRIMALLHPAIQQLDAIIPYLEGLRAKNHLLLHQSRLSLAQHVLQEMDEI